MVINNYYIIFLIVILAFTLYIGSILFGFITRRQNRKAQDLD